MLSGGHLIHGKISSDFLSVMRGHLDQGIFFPLLFGGGAGGLENRTPPPRAFHFSKCLKFFLVIPKENFLKTQSEHVFVFGKALQFYQNHAQLYLIGGPYSDTTCIWGFTVHIHNALHLKHHSCPMRADFQCIFVFR